MTAYNPNLIGRYFAQTSLAALAAEVACLGFVLEPFDGLAWNSKQAQIAGSPTPVIRMSASPGVLEIVLLPWGIPSRRGQGPPLFNFHPGTVDFGLSARVLAPLTSIDGRSGRGVIKMAVGIERQGAWTMLTRQAAQGETLEVAILSEPASWKAWLVRGDLSGR